MAKINPKFHQISEITQGTSVKYNHLLWRKIKNREKYPQSNPNNRHFEMSWILLNFEGWKELSET